MNDEIIIEDVLADISESKSKQADMFDIMHHPTGEKIAAYYRKYEPEAWKGINLLTAMGAIYKARLALGIERAESLKWIKDHQMDLDVLDDLDSDLKDMSVPVKKPGFWL